MLKYLMREKIKHYLKEFILFIIFITVVTNVVSLYKSRNLTQQPLTIKYKSIYPKKPILLHFWATWCPVCKVEAANIQRLSKYYNVITIAVKSNENEIKRYMKKNNLDFKVINDKDALLAQQFNIAVYPTTFIYDKNKKLIFSEVGYTSTFGMWIRLLWAKF